MMINKRVLSCPSSSLAVAIHDEVHEISLNIWRFIMNKNSWTKLDWRIAMDAIKRPFLYIKPAFGRYSVSQDKKKGSKDVRSDS